MRLQRLGTSDLMISGLGLGTWAMGGAGWAFAWGEQDDARSRETVAAALELGVNWIDTAPVYGLGHAEEVVGQALRGRRERPLVFTKCGLVWDDRRRVSQDLSPASIRAEAEASLARLGIDAIDLYQIHWPSPPEQVDEALETLEELRREGTIRAVGVSNFAGPELERATRSAVSVQTMYSLLNRSAEHDVFPVCEATGVGVLCYSSMMSGLLTGRMDRARLRELPPDDWRRRHPEFSEPRLSRNLELVELLRGLGSRRGLSAGSVAAAWCLHNAQVTGVVLGARSPDQLEEWGRAASLTLDDGELARLEALLATIEPLSGEDHGRAFRGELAIEEPTYG